MRQVYKIVSGPYEPDDHYEGAVTHGDYRDRLGLLEAEEYLWTIEYQLGQIACANSAMARRGHFPLAFGTLTAAIGAAARFSWNGKVFRATAWGILNSVDMPGSLLGSGWPQGTLMCQAIRLDQRVGVVGGIHGYTPDE